MHIPFLKRNVCDCTQEYMWTILTRLILHVHDKTATVPQKRYSGGCWLWYKSSCKYGMGLYRTVTAWLCILPLNYEAQSVIDSPVSLSSFLAFVYCFIQMSSSDLILNSSSHNIKRGHGSVCRFTAALPAPPPSPDVQSGAVRPLAALPGPALPAPLPRPCQPRGVSVGARERLGPTTAAHRPLARAQPLAAPEARRERARAASCLWGRKSPEGLLAAGPASSKPCAGTPLPVLPVLAGRSLSLFI